MKQLFTIAFLSLALFANAQAISLKSNYKAPGKGTLKFRTEHFSGSLKASNTELELTVKNTTKQSITLHEKSIVLKDLTGKGETLCGEGELILKPGKTANLILVNCAAQKHPDEGLFQLDSNYPSKAAFKEDAFFLRNKEFFLHINNDVVGFYTDL
jgi:hypothetical protein